MIKNIVFDFGGVIVNLDRERAIRTFVEMGVTDAASLLDPYHQHGVFLEVENGKCNATEFCEKLSTLYKREITDADAERGWLSFMDGVPQKRLALIQELRKTYNVYVLSNINPFVMRWVHSDAFSEDGHPLDDYVDRIFTSYEIKKMKPHREIFDYMIAQTGLRPEESVFLDDGPKNVEAARALGFHTFQPINKEDWTDAFCRMLATL
ncbi:MAG: HAD family phosphatase [Bacteroidaceae bacterium]